MDSDAHSGAYGYYAIAWSWWIHRICFQTAKCMQWHSGIPTVGHSILPGWGQRHEPNRAVAQCATTCGLESRIRLGLVRSLETIATWKAAWRFISLSIYIYIYIDISAMSQIHLILAKMFLDIEWYFFCKSMKCLTMLDNAWHQPRTFPFRTEEKGRGGEKEKAPGHEVSKVDKNSNSILCQGTPKVYQVCPFCSKLLFHWFRLHLCRIGFLHRKDAFHLQRLYHLSGAATSQAQKEEEAQTWRWHWDLWVEKNQKGMWHVLACVSWHGHATWVSFVLQVCNECKQVQSLPPQCFSKTYIMKYNGLVCLLLLDLYLATNFSATLWSSGREIRRIRTGRAKEALREICQRIEQFSFRILTILDHSNHRIPLNTVSGTFRNSSWLRLDDWFLRR